MDSEISHITLNGKPIFLADVLERLDLIPEARNALSLVWDAAETKDAAEKERNIKLAIKWVLSASLWSFVEYEVIHMSLMFLVRQITNGVSPEEALVTFLTENYVQE